MHFIYYQVLFLMLIPSFILMYLIITKKSKIENYFSKNALKKLSVSNKYFSNRTRNVMLFLALIFMIIALSRPVINEKKQNIIYKSENQTINQILFSKSSFFAPNITENFNFLKIIDKYDSKISSQRNYLLYKTYTELFYYPLGIGIFLLLIAFSSLPNFTKNKTLILIFFSLIFIQNPLYSFSIIDFKIISEANEAYENQKYEEASSNFQKIDSNEFRDYNLANSLYKSNEFEKAIELYKNIQTSSNDLEFKRLHNLGNAYAKNKNFNEAINSYEKALKLKNDKKTKENLELVKKVLENKKENK